MVDIMFMGWMRRRSRLFGRIWRRRSWEWRCEDARFDRWLWLSTGLVADFERSYGKAG